ncbi:uncharacterized protein [Oryza sativa Japonica Group]|uniref:Uncharacterized protein n=2 Tax=Oryza sativa subsp. japonica TaxID=39947 RepID=A0A8J8YPL0_ORYSJ|nr:uncharacterized protein LOC4332025 [Oryza sativa Japonica Group]ABF94594.1 expressed protein [Oryza sativa Japonica Group]EAZ26024.1 hypothetical protein OsJ_09877 [Oryza sativa Japonica Group]KAF2937942.1 hypothetical protein DAI22_03g085000 [Oryza sativa Japonica Group]
MLGLRGLVAASPVTAPRCRGRCSAATAATSAPEKTAGHVGRLPLAIVPAAAASLSLVLWSSPVHAGIMSGFKGMESVPGPDLPRVEFLEKWNAENQKKYAEFDSRFKSSQVLKDLLEKSKQNKLKNEREIQDKYCLRGAEWGVGDCSTEGMSDQEKEDFIAELKKRTGQE